MRTQLTLSHSRLKELNSLIPDTEDLRTESMEVGTEDLSSLYSEGTVLLIVFLAKWLMTDFITKLAPLLRCVG